MAPRTKRRMSAHEFDPLVPLLDISDERIAAARAVLVDNQTLQMAAEPYGWKRQSVNSAIKIVWETRERYQAALAISAGVLLPPGWEMVTLVAPSHLVDKFKAEVAATANTALEAPIQDPGATNATKPTARKKKASEGP